ncbi:MAG: HEPN domain-containing protein [Nitrospinae bacterium]|nr:HEPN domain-containing protein [Nitrospinota bacterium]
MKTVDKPPIHKVFLMKAEQDLMLVRKNIDDDDIAEETLLFHLQQAIEKALKSLLSYREIPFGKIHDIAELIRLAEENSIKLPEYIDELDELTPFATTGRYDFPCDSVDDLSFFFQKTEDFLNVVRKEQARNL